MGIRKSCPQRHLAIGRTCNPLVFLTFFARRRARMIWTEHRRIGIPIQLAARMRPKMHNRRPTARHRHGLARDFFQNGPFARLQTQANRFDAFATFDFGDTFTCLNSDPQSPDLIGQFTISLRARIDNRRH